MHSVRIYKSGYLLRIEAEVELPGKWHQGNVCSDEIILYFVEGMAYLYQNSSSSTINTCAFLGM